ncbi:MAG: hypothetical protein ACI9WU_003628, partial [Myxococcota bacterium]
MIHVNRPTRHQYPLLRVFKKRPSERSGPVVSSR